jgi:PAS domain S-box-containing protein
MNDGTPQTTNKGGQQRQAKGALSVKETGGKLNATKGELERLRNELQVHQVELEAQNAELKRMVLELEVSRSKYFDLYDLAPVGYLSINEKGIVLDANLTAATMLGVAKASLVERPLTSYILPADRGCYNLQEKQCVETNDCRDWEMRMLRADGSTFWAHLQSAPSRNNPQTPIMRITLTNIDQRKQFEVEILRDKALLRCVIDSVGDLIYIKDLNGVYQGCNKAFEEFIGFPEVEQIGKVDFDFFDRERAVDIREFDKQVLASGQETRKEEWVRYPDGKMILLYTVKAPYFGPDGTQLGLVGISRDITELHLAKLDALNNQKLESLGVLAGGIAHDFNNILTAIFGNISLARFQMNDVEAVSKRLEDAENAIVRATDLTKQLLTFARGGAPLKKIVEVNRILQETARIVLHDSNANCEFNLANDLWPVDADEGQLAQTVHNLLLNAVQSMPEGGTITLRSEKIGAPLKTNRSVKITISDTGIGIPEQNLQRIFDPYFTTKPQGSGLGLATSYSIVSKHGGEIRATSKVGEGSCFSIYLPASEHEQIPDLGNKTEALFQGCGHVLVMDDNADIRAIAQGILNELGYTADVAENGSEATALYKKRKEQGKPFTAVILDLTIPGGMGGKDTIVELLKMDHDVKAIVSSGYSNDPVMANYRDYGFCAVLSKPYRSQEMSKVLHELLG